MPKITEISVIVDDVEVAASHLDGTAIATEYATEELKHAVKLIRTEIDRAMRRTTYTFRKA